MGILLVYDVTDESSFNSIHHTCASHLLTECKYIYIFLNWCVDIRNWIRNIEQHASDNVNKILVGNKVDMDTKRVNVSKSSLMLDIHGAVSYAYYKMVFG